MASINGLEVKNLKKFKGHEGEDCLQGSVYLNGKKLGFWSQDSWGGCDNFDFNYKVLQDIALKVAMTDLVEPQYRKYFDVDSLMDMLVKLKEDEKVYNKFCKQGYPCTLLVTDGYHCFYSATKDKSSVENKGFALKYFEPQIKKYREKCFKNQEIKVKIYNTKDDFNLRI